VKVDDNGEGKKWPEMHAKFKEKHGIEDCEMKQKQITWLRSQLQNLKLSARELEAAVMTFAALRKKQQKVTSLGFKMFQPVCSLQPHCMVQVDF
jgi:hypothetical protein